jgi:hypothetical protein
VCDPFAARHKAAVETHVADYEVHARNKGVSAKPSPRT